MVQWLSVAMYAEHKAWWEEFGVPNGSIVRQVSVKAEGGKVTQTVFTLKVDEGLRKALGENEGIKVG